MTTVHDFVNDIAKRLKAAGMSAKETALGLKIPGRTDGYSAATYDIHTHPKHKPGPLMIINPHYPEMGAAAFERRIQVKSEGPAPKVSITLRASVLADVDSRGEFGEANRSGVITRDLGRYYEAIKRARAELRKKISEEEMSAILENLNGVSMTEPVSINLIHANVADAIELAGLDTRWKINGAALVKKLQELSFIELCALADAVERWWNRQAQGEKPTYGEALKG